VVEHGQVGVDVQGEPVHRPAPRQADAHGGDLPLAHPDPRVTVLPVRAREPEVAERVDDELLDGPDEGDGVGHAAAPPPRHREDRVADQLAGPVVGDVAAPVGPDEVRPHGRGLDQHVGGVGPHPERVDVRVLEQEQVVVGPGPQARLEGERVGVGDPPQPADPQPGQAISAAQSRVSRISLTLARKAAA
jgi:hypothetical protein